ncbi:MAG: response regulator transcription factor [Synergistetes bacterium]|nr:response regulator transcription factor [Synergistota bacterium]
MGVRRKVVRVSKVYSILLADDHKILREGLRSLINKQMDMNVVAEASDGVSAVDLSVDIKPDIVLMDVMLPKMNGIDATKIIVNRNRTTRVIALSMYANANLVSEMFKAGASGYLLKDCAFDELSRAIRFVAEGRIYVGPGIKKVLSEAFIDMLVRERSKENEKERLTVREIEVLKLLAEGYINKEIADMLHISVNTVARHRQNIMKKMNLKNTAELTRYAIRKGYISV